MSFRRLMRPLRRGIVVWLWAMALAQAAVVVPVEADLRGEIAAGRFEPARDQLGIRGGHPPLSWDRPVLLRALGDGRYAVELRFDSLPAGGQPVPYKFRIERAGQGPDAGWERGRNRSLRLDLPSPRVARAFDVPDVPAALRRTGTIERLGLVASAHVAAREVQVWLPPGYAADGLRRHPVLYLHDGQNVFDDGAAGAEWQFDDTAQRLVETAAIEAPILVAIESGPNRGFDYTPTAMWMDAARSGTGRAERRGGGAPAYARFLVEELKPLIDQRYRTRPGREHTAVGGSSLGGLVSLWLALHHGQTFGAALVVSPSVWWDDGFPARDALAWAGDAAARPRLWLDMGAREGAEAIPAVRRLQQALMARGWSAATLSYTEDPDGSHDEASWAARVEGMLRFLYGRPPAAPR